MIIYTQLKPKSLSYTWAASGKVTFSWKSDNLPGGEQISLNSISNTSKDDRFYMKWILWMAKDEKMESLVFILFNLWAHLPIVTIPGQKISCHVWPATLHFYTTNIRMPDISRTTEERRSVSFHLQRVNSSISVSGRNESQTLKSVNLPWEILLITGQFSTITQGWIKSHFRTSINSFRIFTSDKQFQNFLLVIYSFGT